MKETVLGYMFDQPRALREAFKNRSIYIDPFLELFKNKKYKKIIFVGSGTSYNVSVLAEYYFKHLVGMNAEAHYPTVFKNYEKADWTGELKKEEILFVGISQSGTSISTMDLIKEAGEKGYDTLVLTEDLESEITNFAGNIIHLLCGKELTPPETRGYTVSVLQVYLWALSLARFLDKISQDKYEELLSETSNLLDNFELVLKESEDWYENNAKTIVNSDRIYVLGFGIDFASALEGMLKIGEMLRLPTIAYELEEYSHGPTMALTDRQTIIIFGSDEVEWERSLKFRDAFKEYSDRVHLITNKKVEHDERDLIFSLPFSKYIAPIAYTIPIQFISAKGAKDIGIDTNINPFKIELAHLG